MKLNSIMEKLLQKNYPDDILLTLIVGASGSGKSSLEQALIDKGYWSVRSYTTRPKRDRFDNGHIFVSKEEFDALSNKVAYTEFDGYEYCATKEQVDKADIYIIDPSGVEKLKELYQTDREIAIVYLDTREEICKNRMKARGDSDEQIAQRLENDKSIFKIENVNPDAVIDGNAQLKSVVNTFEEVHKTLLFNAKLNKLETEEVAECRFISQDPRLP